MKRPEALSEKSTFSGGVIRATAFSTALWIALFLATIYNYGYDFTRFVYFGENYTDRESVAGNPTVIKRNDGYDGQFYYRLALNPFTRRKTDFGIKLDEPALRHQRIMYPLLVWAATGGGRHGVAFAMVAVNLAALIALCWLGASLAASMGREPVWGFLFSLFPGLIVAFRMDLTEPVTAALLTAYLLAARRERWALAAVMLSLAALARESVMIVAAGAAAELILARTRGKPVPAARAAWSALPFAVFAAVQFALYLDWGKWPIITSGGANTAPPFAAFLSYVRWLARAHDVLSFVSYMEIAGVIYAAVLGLFVCVRNRFAPFSHVAWLFLYSAVLFSLGSAWNPTFLRVFTEFFILCSYVILHKKRGVADLALLLFTFLWFLFSAADNVITDYFVIHSTL